MVKIAILVRFHNRIEIINPGKLTNSLSLIQTIEFENNIDKEEFKCVIPRT